MAYLTDNPEFFLAKQRLIERDLEPSFEAIQQEMRKCPSVSMTRYEIGVTWAAFGLLLGFVIGYFVR